MRYIISSSVLLSLASAAAIFPRQENGIRPYDVVPNIVETTAQPTTAPTSTGCPEAPKPTYANDISGMIPWVNGKGRIFSEAEQADRFKLTPRVNLAIGGEGVETKHFTGFSVDTGSGSLCVSANYLPEKDQLVNLPQEEYDGYMYYTNNLLSSGKYMTRDVTFKSADGKQDVVSRIRILAVIEQVTCKDFKKTWKEGTPPVCPEGQNLTIAKKGQSGMAFMGVGWGSDPAMNPFLNIISIGGKPVKSLTEDSAYGDGYVLTKKGVQIGITAESAKGMDLTKLNRPTTHTKGPFQWAGPKGSFSITAPGATEKGPEADNMGILIDTGMTQMNAYLPAIDGKKYPVQTEKIKNTKGVEVTRVAVGSKIEVKMGCPTNPIAQYEFDVVEVDKDGNPIKPTSPMTPWSNVIPHWGGRSVNVGVRMLRTFDMMFDARNGIFGMRKAELSPA